MKRRQLILGGAVTLLGAANPMMAQQPPGFQAPGIMPGRPYKVDNVKGVGKVEGVGPVAPVVGMAEPKLSLLDRTRLLLYRVGLLKDAPESPIITAPGSTTRAPRADR